jgi:nickel-dependent lactate racemase
MSAHSYEILDCRRSTWGITTGSPVYELVTEAALVTAPDFIVNVALNRNKETTGVFSGDLRAAHAAGVEYVKSVAMQRVPEPFDIVITTNSGYPLDRNLYQTVKGMCAAASVVKPGGAIIVAAQCVDGVPSGSSYQRLLEKSGTPEGAVKLISSPGFSALDQWQLQIQARVQLKAKVCLYSEGLSDEEIKNAMLTPCHDIEETLAALMVEHGPGAPICVLPEGP